MSDFHQFRVSEIVEIEIEASSDDDPDNLIRFFLVSRVGDQTAVELTPAHARKVQEAISAYLAKLPSGRMPN